MGHPVLAHQAQAGECGIQPWHLCIGVQVHETAQGQCYQCADGQITQHTGHGQNGDGQCLGFCTPQPTPPAIGLQPGIDDLQQGFRIQLGLKKHDGVQHHHKKTNGPGYRFLAGHQPHRQHAQTRRPNFRSRRTWGRNLPVVAALGCQVRTWLRPLFFASYSAMSARCRHWAASAVFLVMGAPKTGVNHQKAPPRWGPGCSPGFGAGVRPVPGLVQG